MNIIHYNSLHRFEAVVDGYTAHVDYSLTDGALNILHTIVPSEIGGKGIAGALVKAAYDYALEENLLCAATCSYAARWLENHPEYKRM